MKVIMLRSNPVAPDPRIEKEANSLLKDSHKVTILAWDREENYRIKEDVLNLKNGQVDIKRVGIKSIFGAGFKKNLLPLMKFQIALIKYLIKNYKSYDIIHACDFDTALSAWLCSKILKKKYIYDIFDYYVDAYSVPKKMKKIIEKIDHTIIEDAQATIICTEKRIEQLKGARPKKLVVIHNSPNKEAVEIVSEEYLGNKIKFVYVGILNDGRFIKELIGVIKNKKNCELHIAGFGKLEEYVIKQSKACENIKFYGKIPYNETIKLENSCDIMTAIYDPKISNHYYAAPNKFYEALMLGKPLIMVRNTGMDDIILKYNIGEVIEYSVESLEVAIENLISRKEKWGEMEKVMKTIYEQEYSWEKMEERLLRVYKEV